MVPTSWLAVALFFLLIAPGVFFEILSEKRRAGFTESAFREISRIVLFSTVFTGVGVGVVALLRTTWAPSMPDPGMWLRHSTAYVHGHYRLVLRALLIEIGVAFAAVWLVHRALCRRSPARIRRTSAWGEVFRKELPEGWEARARLRLEDGSVWIGTVAGFTADLATEGREIVLAPPLYSRHQEAEITEVPEPWRRVVVKGDDIRSVAVSYHPKQSGAEKLSRKRRKRLARQLGSWLTSVGSNPD